MNNHILVYYIYDHPGNGGGTYFESFSKIEQLEERVTELTKQNKELFEIICSGYLQEEYKYKAVKVTVEYRIDNR